MVRGEGADTERRTRKLLRRMMRVSQGSGLILRVSIMNCHVHTTAARQIERLKTKGYLARFICFKASNRGTSARGERVCSRSVRKLCIITCCWSEEVKHWAKGRGGLFTALVAEMEQDSHKYASRHKHTSGMLSSP